MIIKCEIDISDEEFGKIRNQIEEAGLEPDILRKKDGEHHPIVGLKGDTSGVSRQRFARLRGVEEVQRVTARYKLASREYHPHDSVIEVGDVKVGGSNSFVTMAGPCAVEGREQIIRIARMVKDEGADVLRGGAWKPRTYARSFEGLKEEGLKYLDEARGETGLPIITEILGPELIDTVGEYTDIFQVGARNMQNYDLLNKLGDTDKPILLKRNPAATIDEFLGAADRIMQRGNKKVLLCLRGVRSFDRSQRYPADLYAIPDLKEKTHLPVIFDPSHPAGKRHLVPSLARMAIAGGADGILIETHYNPEKALCDGAQMVTPDKVGELVDYAKKIRNV